MSVLKYLKKIILPEVDAFIVPLENENKEVKIEFIELKEAWDYFKKEEFEKARAIANNHLTDHRNTLQHEANKIIALTYFRQGDYEKSTSIFERLASNSTNTDDWFNLVSSLTLISKYSESEIALKKAIALRANPENKNDISIPNMRYYYMQSLKEMEQYQRAFTQLEVLSDFYTQFTITDSTFLYMRGMPFFQHTVDSSKEILENINPSVSKKWISTLKNGIDNYGKEYLIEFEQKLNLSN